MGNQPRKCAKSVESVPFSLWSQTFQQGCHSDHHLPLILLLQAHLIKTKRKQLRDKHRLIIKNSLIALFNIQVALIIIFSVCKVI